MNWLKLFLKLKNAIDFLAIISVFGILIYRMDTLRKICKNICQYFADWLAEYGIDIDLMSITRLYLRCETIFRITIVFFFVFTVLNWVIKLFWERWLKKQRGENRFEESIFRYLHDSNIPRCFLVTGKWGSGKTYEVQKFFDKYYRYSRTKVFRVSCFGLNSRKGLIEEISNTIEQKDDSIYALVIKVLQFFPIIGEPVGKFLKKSYGYDSVQKKSIFIFDDFERITSRTITNNSSSHLYKKSSSIRGGGSTTREFQDIRKEFESIASAFSKIENIIDHNSLKEDYDKYVAVIGLINEIVEIYGMKVIIVCNPEMLGEKFIHDVLRSKLNCMECKKVISTEAKISIVDRILSNKTFEDKAKQDVIVKYLNFIKGNLEKIMFDTKFDDLRLFGGLLEAFISTAVLFEKDMLTNEFMNSLFNSILITHLAFYSNSIEWLEFLETGANIEMLMKIFGEEISPFKLIRFNGGGNEIKWVDVSISGYWIFNLSSPDDISEVSSTWKNYKYSQIEEKMCEDYHIFLSLQDYDLLHILFFQKCFDAEKDGGAWNSAPYISKVLMKYDITQIEVVQNILDTVSRAFRREIFQGFEVLLFNKLAEGHAVGRVDEYSNIHRCYNMFVFKEPSCTRVSD